MVAGNEQANPTAETIKISMVRAEVGKRMGLTPEQMAAVKGTMRDFVKDAVKEWNERLRSGPAAYRQIATVPWHTLPDETQAAILQICTAVDAGKVEAAFLAQYMDLACKAVEYQMPPTPFISTLGGFGRLAGDMSCHESATIKP